jgi:hypothetical protein
MEIFHEPDTESWKELRFLLLYCMECNPRFVGTESKLFEGMGS